MNCFVHLLALCVFDPSNVYLRPSIDYAIDSSHTMHPALGLTTHEGAWCVDHWCHGPIGTLELGYAIELSRELTVSYRMKHVSFISEHDRGYESFGVDLVWRPFARE